MACATSKSAASFRPRTEETTHTARSICPTSHAFWNAATSRWGSGAHYQRNGKVLHNIIRSSAQAADYLINSGVQFVYAFAGTTEEDIMRAHSPLLATTAMNSVARVRERGL